MEASSGRFLEFLIGTQLKETSQHIVTVSPFFLHIKIGIVSMFLIASISMVLFFFYSPCIEAYRIKTGRGSTSYCGCAGFQVP